MLPFQGGNMVLCSEFGAAEDGAGVNMILYIRCSSGNGFPILTYGANLFTPSMHSAAGQSVSGTKSYAGLILACYPPLPPISPIKPASSLFSHSYPIPDGAPPSKFAAPYQRAKLSLLTFPSLPILPLTAHRIECVPGIY